MAEARSIHAVLDETRFRLLCAGKSALLITLAERPIELTLSGDIDFIAMLSAVIDGKLPRERIGKVRPAPTTALEAAQRNFERDQR